MSEKYPIDLRCESDVSMLACSKLLVLKQAYKIERGLILGTFRLLILELLGREIQLFSYLKNVQNILMTFLAVPQVSDCFALGYF